MPERKLKIAELLLDHINPRNDPAQNQRQALQQIIDDQDVKLDPLFVVFRFLACHHRSCRNLRLGERA